MGRPVVPQDGAHSVSSHLSPGITEEAHIEVWRGSGCIGCAAASSGGSLKQLAGAVIGLAGGLGVNELSEGFGFEAVAVAAGVGSVPSATTWLRQRPRAPIVRMASRVFLVLAALAPAVAAVAALSGPASWVG